MARMKAWIKAKIKKYKEVIAISLTLLVVIVVVGVIVTCYAKTDEHAETAAGVNAALTAGLVLLAGGSMFGTYRALRKADTQAQIAREAQYNAVAPVIKLSVMEKAIQPEEFILPVVGRKPGDEPEQKTLGPVPVYYENVGNGPALNVRVCIQDEQIEELQYPSLARTHKAGTLAVRETGHHVFETGIEGYRLESGVVRAQYESIFGEEKTYESQLLFPTNDIPRLEFGEVKDPKAIFPPVPPSGG